jgi:hypothetical protein
VRKTVCPGCVNGTHELSTNAVGAMPFRKEVEFGAAVLVIQTEERNGLLFSTPHGRSLSGIPGDHAEIFREDGGLARLVGVEVVCDRSTIYQLKRAVRIFEVQLREPVHGLVFQNARRGTH